MAANGMNNGKSRKADLPLRARHKGQQFIVNLRAIKSTFGLVQAPRALTIGDGLMLQSPGSQGRLGPVQLFAKVAREHRGKLAYVLSWEKLVSPSGTSPLIEFLQELLGLSVCTGEALIAHDGIVSGEMVYYVFADGALHLPGQKRVISRESLLGVGSQPEATGARDQSEIPVEPRPRPATADREPGHAEESQAEDGEYVEMFGMRVRADQLDRLDNLQYSSTSPDGETRRRSSPPPTAPPGRNGTGANGQAPQADGNGKKPEGGVSRFLRKLADKLADKE